MSLSSMPLARRTMAEEYIMHWAHEAVAHRNLHLTLMVIMTSQLLEDNQPVVLEPLTRTINVLIDQPQSIPAPRWACHQGQVVHLLTRGMTPLTVIITTRSYPIYQPPTPHFLVIPPTCRAGRISLTLPSRTCRPCTVLLVVLPRFALCSPPSRGMAETRPRIPN